MLSCTRSYCKITIFFALVFSLISCLDQSKQEWKSHKSKTMGTTYNIVYQSDRDFSKLFEALLEEFNRTHSTYIPTSTISKINAAKKTEITFAIDTSFISVYSSALEVAHLSNGYFDYTVMPIVSHYGFGPQQAKKDTLMDWDEFIGYTNVSVVPDNDSMVITKMDERVSIDFSAIAKGAAVDLVADFLRTKGIDNFMVEIGGEVFCSGVNAKEMIWRIGVESPEKGKKFLEVINVEDCAVATSGNYRNIRVIDGKKYAHTIDPYQGKPVLTDVLSATVLSKSCAHADAWATAFMAMGSEKAKQIAVDRKLRVLLAIADSNGVKIWKTSK